MKKAHVFYSQSEVGVRIPLRLLYAEIGSAKLAIANCPRHGNYAVIEEGKHQELREAIECKQGKTIELDAREVVPVF